VNAVARFWRGLPFPVQILLGIVGGLAVFQLFSHLGWLLVVLAVLFHDIGKPCVKHYNEERRVRYTGHDNSKFFAPVAERMKLSTEETSRISHCIDNHMIAFDVPELRKSRAIEIVEHPFWGDLWEVLWADSNCNAAAGIPVSVRVARQLVDIEARIAELTASKEPEKVTKLRKLINGNWIRDTVGASGPMIGHFKKMGIDFAIDHNLDPDDPETTLDSVRIHIQRGRLCSLGSLFPK
jgi:poly(A) polymerase